MGEFSREENSKVDWTALRENHRQFRPVSIIRYHLSINKKINKSMLLVLTTEFRSPGEQSALRTESKTWNIDFISTVWDAKHLTKLEMCSHCIRDTCNNYIHTTCHYTPVNHFWQKRKRCCQTVSPSGLLHPTIPTMFSTLPPQFKETQKPLVIMSIYF